APASWAIARSNLRRSPRSTTPSSSLRSSSVRSRRIEKSIRCSTKRSAYCDNPSEASHSLTDSITLRVPAHEVGYPTAQPFEIGTCRRAGECLAVELARRNFCECLCRLLRARSERPRCRRARQGDELPPSDVEHGLPLGTRCASLPHAVVAGKARP